MLNVRSTAGRHAADMARVRAADRNNEECRRVRERLAERLKAHGLLVFADITARPNVEPSISANVRLALAAQDEAFVFALLDDEGWRIVTGRHRAYGHFLQCEHRAFGAELLLIVKLPHAEVPRAEAA